MTCFISVISPIQNHDVACGTDCISREYWNIFPLFNITGNSNTMYPKQAFEFGRQEMIIHLVNRQPAFSYFMKTRFSKSYFLHIIVFQTIGTKTTEFTNANLKWNGWFSAHSHITHISYTFTLIRAYSIFK